MITSEKRAGTGRVLFWVGAASVVLTVMFFLGGFALGNSFGAQAAMTVLLTGLILSVIASLTSAVIAVAGIVAFPFLRGRFIGLLVLALLCSPLLWLLCLVLLS
ncbi:hypothetical protein [Kocuria sp.]|uniref:hypothetical protein n=1 Tax=Kocuria sp. TaxID=1871328 RepID=UPI0026DAA1EB|nr:hypothetical protein [Kocuria sp.]MDO4919096.1 hypothetical protein [Kocuria sp.]